MDRGCRWSAGHSAGVVVLNDFPVGLPGRSAVGVAGPTRPMVMASLLFQNSSVFLEEKARLI